MTLRFQRSLKIGPGLRVTLSRAGVGASAGTPGLRVGVDSKSREYMNISLPGTGLSARLFRSYAQSHKFPLRQVVLVGLGLGVLALGVTFVALFKA
ncbi:MAG TPA: DUF4236 domain-containing protein [Bryobacteraceae bacterium]|jgi:hypothetical protein